MLCCVRNLYDSNLIDMTVKTKKPFTNKIVLILNNKLLLGKVISYFIWLNHMQTKIILNQLSFAYHGTVPTIFESHNSMLWS